MNKIKKILLLMQFNTGHAISINLNFALIFYLIFGIYGIFILFLTVPISRIIEERKGYSYYQEALHKPKLRGKKK